MVKELIRFIYVIAGNLHRAWMIPLMGYYSRHPEKYSERFRYEYNKHAIRLMNHTGRIYTQAYGAENLPKDGGYVMFANHQGKYDALGIMLTHEEPCSVVMDEARIKMPLVKQFIDMVGGKRLCLHDLRQAARVIREVRKKLGTDVNILFSRQAVTAIAMAIMWMRLRRAALRVPCVRKHRSYRLHW